MAWTKENSSIDSRHWNNSELVFSVTTVKWEDIRNWKKES